MRDPALLVDCGATAHIIRDKSKFTSFYESFKSERHYIELANTLARGDVNVAIKDLDGKHVNASLKDTLCIPSYPQDIFSVHAATGKGASVNFQPDHARLVHKDSTKFDIEKHGRLTILAHVMIRLLRMLSMLSTTHVI
jgi:hypothetical protein